MLEEKKEFRPFYKVALDKIKAGPSTTDMELLMSLIGDVEILENQDEIIETLEKYFKNYNEEWKKEVAKIRASLSEQKKIAEAEAATRKETTEKLKELQQKVHELLRKPASEMKPEEVISELATSFDVLWSYVAMQSEKSEVAEKEKKALEADVRMIEKGY